MSYYTVTFIRHITQSYDSKQYNANNPYNIITYAMLWFIITYDIVDCDTLIRIITAYVVLYSNTNMTQYRII